MTTPSLPQFWHISFPTYDENGLGSSLVDIAENESDARSLASMHSRTSGHATISNREGHVATFVGGREWWPNRTTGESEERTS